MKKLKSNFIKKFKVKSLIHLFTYSLILLFAQSVHAQSNIPGFGTVGEYGQFNTVENLGPIHDTMRSDISEFDRGFSDRVSDADGQLLGSFTPPEAVVGRALIAGLTMMTQIINNSLGGMISILLILLFAFWIMLEAWNVIQGDKKEIKDLVKEIARKGMWISIWFIILNNNPVDLFMMIALPIVMTGTFISDTILNAVTMTVGVPLPDTCYAIRAYMAANPISDYVITSSTAAELLCMPTRMSGFFWTAVAAGLRWMWVGVGSSLITFIAGMVFVVLFVRAAFKFAIEALGVISSLFIALMFLPFTAVAECFDDKGKYKDGGVISSFFGMLTNMFGGKKLKLQGQFLTFIHAAIYYIVLSVVAGIGLALLSVVARTGFADVSPTIYSDSFMMILIVGALVAHLANKAGDIAKDLGGKIEGDFGKKVGDDLKGWWGDTKKSAASWRKAWKGK